LTPSPLSSSPSRKSTPEGRSCRRSPQDDSAAPGLGHQTCSAGCGEWLPCRGRAIVPIWRDCAACCVGTRPGTRIAAPAAAATGRRAEEERSGRGTR